MSNNINSQYKHTNKFYFVGVSLSPNSINESGFAVLDKTKNIIRIDKFFHLEDLENYLESLAPLDTMIVCVDLPRNIVMNIGKWRQEARNTRTFKISDFDMQQRFVWTKRFSDRGSDLCKTLVDLEVDVYRYYCYLAKNYLNLNSPYKSRSPADCKHLQMAIHHSLHVKGIPSNLIPLSGLEALMGAYTALKIGTAHEGEGYFNLGEYGGIPIINPTA